MALARKTSDIPTRVYRYGLLQPTEGAAELRAQIRRAHRYYNQLVELEHARRKAFHQARAALPQVAPHEAEVEAAETALAQAQQAILDARDGDPKADTSALERQVLQAKRLCREARTRRKDAYAAVKDHPLLVAASTAANAAAHDARLRARAAHVEEGGYWGTYLGIEAAVEQASRAPIAPPRPGKRPWPWYERPAFSHWEGEGRIGVQFQHGVPVADLFADDTRLQILPVPTDTWARPRSARERASRSQIKIRVRSTGPGGRTPVWVHLPVVLHRPLPPDAKAMWAHVVQRRIGRDYQYHLLLTLEAESFRPPPCSGTGTIAIDVGWRNLDDGGIRVAYWADDSGAHGEIRVPDRTIAGMPKVFDLQAIRDRHFDAVRIQLGAWLATLPRETWIVDPTLRLDKWRSTARLAGLWHKWKRERIPGDEAAFATVGEWFRHDAHLLAWQEWQRTGRLLHRDEQYKIWAAWLAHKYRRVVFENFDLRTFAMEPELEDGGLPSDDTVQRATANLAACGTLRSAVLNAAQREGLEVRWVGKEPTTMRCHRCGDVDDTWNPRFTLKHTCRACGHTWDQDHNATLNLLALDAKGASSAVRLKHPRIARTT